MKIRDFILSLVSWFILLVTVSCSDELGGERAPISSESNLHVLVPTVLSSRGTRADDASGLPTYNATVDECQINDLTLYAFPVPTGNGNDGKLLVETLPAPLATMMVEQHVANYQLTIEPGTYHIYVVANMNKVLSGQTIKTENELKNIVLGYGVGAEPGMPVSTNIPMIYEPEKDAAGNLAEIVITAAGDKYTEVAANLKFTCVKVKLNLIFDPSDPDVATNFGGKAFSINSISADKLSPFTHLYWGGKFETPTWADKDYKDGFSSNMYQASERPAVYYTDWTDNRSASATNNNDDIKGTGKATEDPPVNPADKWLFQQTYYLPERYISSESDRSYLTINGKVGDYADNNYRIDLGHKKDETSTTEVPVFPRGTFYEITGAIKSLGNMELDCKVSIKPWETVPIDADFNHTTLWVSKTEASVTSTTNDIILYNSNAAVVEFGCINTIFVNGKDEPIIIQKKRGKDANGKDSIEFRVNPAIPVSAYPASKQSGTAKFYLKANNLYKYIDVHYDVTPYLDVTKELVIYYGSTVNNTRTIKWDTNLGGIKLEKTSSSIGNSTINMSLSESNAATGTFTVTAVHNPITTTIHEFKVTSKDDEKRYQTVRVKVRPPVDDYRIYFRAINDRNKYTNGTEDRFQGILPEGGSKNWSDGWNANSTDTDESTPKNHHIYVYTQIGETTQDGSGNIKQKRWIYTAVQDAPDGKDRSNWPGERMVADNTNTGWYYKDFAVDMNPVRKIPSDEEENRKIKPGETLIMFNNCENVDAGFTKHRCPHHMEPGIPLFDYEDHEGWIVYDPTSDPEWHMYDGMPEIENIAITIYTKERTWGWWKNYGIKGGGEFIIEDKTTGDNQMTGNSWTLKKVGTDWWKTVIHLKAIKGEHNKNIRINLKDTNILLFDGNSFKDDTGYYADGKWKSGKPEGVSE